MARTFLITVQQEDLCKLVMENSQLTIIIEPIEEKSNVKRLETVQSKGR